MEHVVVAPDKFKGSATAAEVAARLGAGLRATGASVVELPVADGGDGTLDAAVAAGYRRVPIVVSGPTGRPVPAAFALRNGMAVIELAGASGLVLLPDGPEPLVASSRGTGELVRAALDAGATSIVLGVGGSASTDGGTGMLAALGARFTDVDGAELPDGGGALPRLAAVDLTGLDPRLARVEVTLASDVDNPLLGDTGAAAVYGPQKGAAPDDVACLERGLARLASLIDPGAAHLAGAGAAGGVGYAARTVLRATMRPGIDVVLELVGFTASLEGAALVVTGEGRLDAQTLHGKAPAGIAAAARRAGVPVVAVCGVCDLDDHELAMAGFAAVHALTALCPDEARCRSAPGPLLETVGRALVGRDVEMTEPGLTEFNDLGRERAVAALLSCCTAPQWAGRVADARPYASVSELQAGADAALTPDDLETALSHHPRIGERTASDRSAAEQAGVGVDVVADLAEANRAYEQRFGHTYLVCAAGRSGAELLATLRARLANDPVTERRVALRELAAINRLRLRALISS